MNVCGQACICLLLKDVQWSNRGREYCKDREYVEAFICGHLPEQGSGHCLPASVVCRYGCQF